MKAFLVTYYMLFSFGIHFEWKNNDKQPRVKEICIEKQPPAHIKKSMETLKPDSFVFTTASPPAAIDKEPSS